MRQFKCIAYGLLRPQLITCCDVTVTSLSRYVARWRSDG